MKYKKNLIVVEADDGRSVEFLVTEKQLKVLELIKDHPMHQKDIGASIQVSREHLARMRRQLSRLPFFHYIKSEQTIIWYLSGFEKEAKEMASKTLYMANRLLGVEGQG